MTQTQAQLALVNAALRDSTCTNVQFFTRSTIYTFSDNSRLTVNFMSGTCYAH